MDMKAWACDEITKTFMILKVSNLEPVVAAQTALLHTLFWNLKVTQAGVLMQSMAQKAAVLALVSSNLTKAPDWTSTALKLP